MTDATDTGDAEPDAGERPDGHLTDAARLEVRADGANEPVQGNDPQLRPGEAGNDDAAPAIVGGEQDDDRASDQRQALMDRVEEDRAGD